MTNTPTPPPSGEEPLIHVGWWCWRGDNHGHLATTACRSDNVPIHVPAEWAHEMRAVIRRIEDGDDEQQPAVLPAVPVPPTTHATERAALRDRIAEALDNAHHTHPCPVTGSQYWTGCHHPDGTSSSCHTNRRTAAVLAVLPPPADRAAVVADDEGDELVCVDQCGSCDACGMEPFGTPAEGWRQAAHFLRRTARESGDRAGALHGARLIEAELRRMADEAQQQPDTETVAEAEAERLATLTDCPNSRNGGLHCDHYQQGDGPCCHCQRPNWCPEGGVA